MRELFFKHPFILLFGILQIFFSAPGQTFLISLFVSPIFLELGVSVSWFAGVYSAATLSAALLLNPAGRFIDRYHMRTIIIVVTCLMAIGCWAVALAQDLVVLFIGFFLLRLIGQGVFSLAASTLMIKTFEKNRGKALGITTLGFPLSEAIYPFLALFLLSHFQWRGTYLLFGLSTILMMLPLQLYLLKKANIQHGEFYPGEIEINPQRMRGNPEQRKIRPHRDFTLNEVVRDGKFYLILTAACLPPMVVTGLFFHQGSLFESNEWTISLAASGFVTYAVCKAIASVWVGSVVDRYGPMIPFAVLILMLGLGTLIASLGGSPVMMFIYFMLIGASLGFSAPVINVVWAHFYGVKHIGSIKGLVATFRNGVTALGPLPIALCLDAGISINVVLKITAFAIMLFVSLPFIIGELDRYQMAGEAKHH